MRLKTAAVYIRVSTNDQLDYSPDSQLNEIKAYAKQNGIIIMEIYIFMESEGHSGKKADNRPEFQKMIATAKQKPKPFDVILVWKFSRFARNQDESTFYKSMLRKKLGIDVISISEPILEGMYGRLIETIIEWQDEFYSYNLGIEVTRGMTQKAKLGEPQVAPPLGYKVPYKGATPEIVPEEAEIVRLIFKMFNEGIGAFGIARHLTDCGITGKRGGQVWSTSIKRMLKNPYYAGYSRWNGITEKAEFPAIIDETTFKEVQKKLVKENAPKYAKPGELYRHWLSGVMRCSCCGKTMTSQVIHSPKKDYIIFQCGGYVRGICKTSHYVKSTTLENVVLKALDAVLNLGTVEFTIKQSSTIDNNQHVNIIKTQLKNSDIRLERIKSSYMAGIDTLEEYKTAKTSILEERERLIKQLEQLHAAYSKPEEKMLSNILNAYTILTSDQYSIAQKNTAIKSVIEKVVYTKKEKHVDVYYYLNDIDLME